MFSFSFPLSNSVILNIYAEDIWLKNGLQARTGRSNVCNVRTISRRPRCRDGSMSSADSFLLRCISLTCVTSLWQDTALNASAQVQIYLEDSEDFVSFFPHVSSAGCSVPVVAYSGACPPLVFILWLWWVLPWCCSLSFLVCFIKIEEWSTTARRESDAAATIHVERLKKGKAEMSCGQCKS